MTRRVMPLALIAAACSGPPAAPVEDAGAGPVTVCAPGSAIACYDGPAPALGVGLCAAGTAACNAEGTAYGPCAGQVTPAAPDCAGSADEDCDGAPGCHGQARWTALLPFVGDPIFAVAADGSASVAPADPEPLILVRLGSDGSRLWTRDLAAGGALHAEAIAVDGAGRTFVGGGCDAGVVDLGAGPEEVPDGAPVFLAAYDAGGDLIWRRFTTALFDVHLAASAAGEVTVAGRGYGMLDLDGNPLPSYAHSQLARLSADGALLWTRPFVNVDPATIAAAQDGSVIVGGTVGPFGDLGGGPLGPGTMNQTPFLARFDAGGSHLWSHITAGDPIALAAGGEIALTGGYEGAFDLDAAHGCPAAPADQHGLFAAGLDLNGKSQWIQCLAMPVGGGAAAAMGPAGERAFAGSVPAVAGAYPLDLGSGPIAAAAPLTGFDYGYVAVLAPGGALRLARRMDLGHQGRVRAAAFDASGDLFVAGRFTGAVDLGSGAVSALADRTAFVARLAP